MLTVRERQRRQLHRELKLTRKILLSTLTAYHSYALDAKQECYCPICKAVRTEIPALP